MRLRSFTYGFNLKENTQNMCWFYGSQEDYNSVLEAFTQIFIYKFTEHFTV